MSTVHGSAERLDSVRSLAPAKLNLVLEVVARREDGYHEVDTLMVALDWHDVLVLGRRAEPGVGLAVGGGAATPDVPRDGTNLAARAAGAVLAAAGVRGGIALALEKYVPSGAGLGGGSADAAAAALGAARLLGTEPPAGLLAALGSDCAFFAEAATTGIARCTGRGERVAILPAPTHAWTATVVVPAALSPTGSVYAGLCGPLSGRDLVPTVHAALCEGSEAELRRGLRNDLEAAALAAVPALQPVRALLDELGESHFRLTGSGSAFFGLYREGAEARGAAERIARDAASRGVPLRAVRSARLSAMGVAVEALR